VKNYIYTGYDLQALERAKGTVESFKKFIEENRDEVTALQIIYSKPYDQRHLTYEQIKLLAEAIERPPYGLNPDLVWQAYEQLDKSRVKGAGPQKLLTNIVSLVRFAMGESPVLSPFPDAVNERFDA
jgi:type I restriction enzyme R subunit